LSFTNGSFGPTFLGPSRKWLCASPPQVNVRVYVRPVGAGAPENDAVFYLSVNMQDPWMVLAGRLFADGLPVHCARTLLHTRQPLPDSTDKAADYAYSTLVDGGAGSALDLNLQMTTTGRRTLAPCFARIFGNYENAAQFIFDRNRAVCVRDKRPVPGDPQQLSATVVESLIVPPLPGVRSRRLVPAETDMTRFEASAWLAEMVDGCEHLSFVIPAIDINVDREHTTRVAFPVRPAGLQDP
jgi:hypothetical protein